MKKITVKHVVVAAIIVLTAFFVVEKRNNSKLAKAIQEQSEKLETQAESILKIEQAIELAQLRIEVTLEYTGELFEKYETLQKKQNLDQQRAKEDLRKYIEANKQESDLIKELQKQLQDENI